MIYNVVNTLIQHLPLQHLQHPTRACSFYSDPAASLDSASLPDLADLLDSASLPDLADLLSLPYLLLFLLRAATYILCEINL